MCVYFFLLQSDKTRKTALKNKIKNKKITLYFALDTKLPTYLLLSMEDFLIDMSFETCSFFPLSESIHALTDNH